MWKSPVSSWWCETDKWLAVMWNTYGKSISGFQNPHANVTLTGVFQGRKSENRMWHLTGERWISCYRITNFIRWPWPQRSLIYHHESAIPVTALPFPCNQSETVFHQYLIFVIEDHWSVVVFSPVGVVVNVTDCICPCFSLSKNRLWHFTFYLNRLYVSYSIVSPMSVMCNTCSKYALHFTNAI